MLSCIWRWSALTAFSTFSNSLFLFLSLFLLLAHFWIFDVMWMGQQSHFTRFKFATKKVWTLHSFARSPVRSVVRSLGCEWKSIGVVGPMTIEIVNAILIFATSNSNRTNGYVKCAKMQIPNGNAKNSASNDGNRLKYEKLEYSVQLFLLRDDYYFLPLLMTLFNFLRCFFFARNVPFLGFALWKHIFYASNDFTFVLSASVDAFSASNACAYILAKEKNSRNENKQNMYA